jgi:NADPH-dependent glutamate synthase beta subunit-like oxidoreductase
MDVTIEAIKFNHDPNSATTDALTIRKNEDAEIAVPEWQYVDERESPKTSAAAYACS